MKKLPNGKQCGAHALHGKQYCFSHDPASKEAKMDAVKKGGAVKDFVISKPLDQVDIKGPADIVTLLVRTIGEVRTGDLDPRIATTIGYLTGMLIKAFEVSDIEKRVESLEQAIEKKRI